MLCDQYHPDGRIFLHLVKPLQVLEWIIFRLVMGRSAAASYRVSKVHKLFLSFSYAEGGRKPGRDRQAKSTNFSPPEAALPCDFFCLLLFSFFPHWVVRFQEAVLQPWAISRFWTNWFRQRSLTSGRLMEIQLLISFELMLDNSDLTTWFCMSSIILSRTEKRSVLRYLLYPGSLQTLLLKIQTKSHFLITQIWVFLNRFFITWNKSQNKCDAHTRNTVFNTIALIYKR